MAKRDFERETAIREFICDYIRREHGTDRLDAEFHEEFTNRFGGKRTMYYWGSCPNHLAMQWLKRLYDEGTLQRAPIGLTNHEVGFPNWVYTYSLCTQNES